MGDKTLILDVAFDHYGRRVATCSSKQALQIWDKGESGQWVCSASISKPVTRVAWAHPEFGQVIAACSFDHNVYIWEEQEGVNDKGLVISGWHKRAQLGDARDAVHDVKFAPRHMGLKLAAASSDGYVRLYEATDPTSLAHWEFTDEFEADASGAGVSSITWCGSGFDAAMMAVACSAPGVPVRVWGFLPSTKRWTRLLELRGHGGGVRDVAWAPNLGRSYHLIAAAGVEGVVSMWRVTTTNPPAPSGGAAAGEAGADEEGVWRAVPQPASTLDGSLVDKWNEGASPAWGLEWNLMGTVLAASRDDGTVRLRRLTAGSAWEDAGALATDATQTAAAASVVPLPTAADQSQWRSGLPPGAVFRASGAASGGSGSAAGSGTRGGAASEAAPMPYGAGAAAASGVATAPLPSLPPPFPLGALGGGYSGGGGGLAPGSMLMMTPMGLVPVVMPPGAWGGSVDGTGAAGQWPHQLPQPQQLPGGMPFLPGYGAPFGAGGVPGMPGAGGMHALQQLGHKH